MLHTSPAGGQHRKEINIHIQKIQAGRQKDRQIDRQIEKQIDRQTDRKAN